MPDVGETLRSIGVHLRDNPDAEVTCISNPMHRGYTWVTSESSQTWEITLTDIARYANTNENGYGRMLRSILSTESGRASLVELLRADYAIMSHEPEAAKSELREALGELPEREPETVPRSRFEMILDLD
jgi:hypothetical protein